MPEEVTQENLYNFIPGKAARITTLLRRNRKMALKQALLDEDGQWVERSELKPVDAEGNDVAVVPSSLPLTAMDLLRRFRAYQAASSSNASESSIGPTHLATTLTTF